MVVSQQTYETTDPTVDSQIVAMKGSGADTLVKAFDGTTNGGLIRAFIVNDPNVPGPPPITITGGVNVAASDIDNDGLVDILTGRGVGFRPFAQYYKVSTRVGGVVTGSLTTPLVVNTFGDTYSNGITVGASRLCVGDGPATGP